MLNETFSVIYKHRACHLFSLLKEWVIFEETIGKVDSVISLKQI